MEFINSVIYPTIYLSIILLIIAAGMTLAIGIIAYTINTIDNFTNLKQDKFTYLYVGLVIVAGIFLFCLTIIGMIAIITFLKGTF